MRCGFGPGNRRVCSFIGKGGRAKKQTVEQQLQHRPMTEVWPWVVPVAALAFIIVMVSIPNTVAYGTIGLHVMMIAKSIKISLTTQRS